MLGTVAADLALTLGALAGDLCRRWHHAKAGRLLLTACARRSRKVSSSYRSPPGFDLRADGSAVRDARGVVLRKLADQIDHWLGRCRVESRSGTVRCFIPPAPCDEKPQLRTRVRSRTRTDHQWKHRELGEPASLTIDPGPAAFVFDLVIAELELRAEVVGPEPHRPRADREPVLILGRQVVLGALEHEGGQHRELVARRDDQMLHHALQLRTLRCEEIVRVSALPGARIVAVLHRELVEAAPEIVLGMLDRVELPIRVDRGRVAVQLVGEAKVEPELQLTTGVGRYLREPKIHDVAGFGRDAHVPRLGGVVRADVRGTDPPEPDVDVLRPKAVPAVVPVEEVDRMDVVALVVLLPHPYRHFVEILPAPQPTDRDVVLPQADAPAVAGCPGQTPVEDQVLLVPGVGAAQVIEHDLVVELDRLSLENIDAEADLAVGLAFVAETPLRAGLRQPETHLIAALAVAAYPGAEVTEELGQQGCPV